MKLGSIIRLCSKGKAYCSKAKIIKEIYVLMNKFCVLASQKHDYFNYSHIAGDSITHLVSNFYSGNLGKRERVSMNGLQVFIQGLLLFLCKLQQILRETAQ